MTSSATFSCLLIHSSITKKLELHNPVKLAMWSSWSIWHDMWCKFLDSTYQKSQKIVLFLPRNGVASFPFSCLMFFGCFSYLRFLSSNSDFRIFCPGCLALGDGHHELPRYGHRWPRIVGVKRRLGRIREYTGRQRHHNRGLSHNEAWLLKHGFKRLESQTWHTTWHTTSYNDNAQHSSVFIHAAFQTFPYMYVSYFHIIDVNSYYIDIYMYTLYIYTYIILYVFNT